MNKIEKLYNKHFLVENNESETLTKDSVFDEYGNFKYPNSFESDQINVANICSDNSKN